MAGEFREGGSGLSPKELRDRMMLPIKAQEIRKLVGASEAPTGTEDRHSKEFLAAAEKRFQAAAVKSGIAAETVADAIVDYLKTDSSAKMEQVADANNPTDTALKENGKVYGRDVFRQVLERAGIKVPARF